MILVTVGTHNQPFDRLLRKIDRLAENKAVTAIFAQTGYSGYKPQNYKYRNFIRYDTFLRLIAKSKLVITHAGAGTIMNILFAGKPAVVVPRLSKYGEHTNNHQLEITKQLANNDTIIPVFDIENLEEAITKADKFNVKKQSSSSGIFTLIQAQIQEWNQDQ